MLTVYDSEGELRYDIEWSQPVMVEDERMRVLEHAKAAIEREIERMHEPDER